MTYLVMCSCTNCKQEFTTSCIKGHYDRCVVKGGRNPIKPKLAERDNNRCIFCDKECKNNNSLRNHERLCKSNPARQIPYFATTNFQNNGHKKSNGAIKAREMGYTYIVSDETRQKQSVAITKRTGEFNKEIGKKISNTINKKVSNGEWHTSIAKRISYKYNGVILHGTWELKYAQYLDINHIKWDRVKCSFPYFFKGKWRRYTPDFYLPKTDEYVEIKGYKREIDDAKWSQFPSDKKLIVLMGNDLKLLGVI
jgi:hypothetical protein